MLDAPLEKRFAISVRGNVLCKLLGDLISTSQLYPLTKQYLANSSLALLLLNLASIDLRNHWHFTISHKYLYLATTSADVIPMIFLWTLEVFKHSRNGLTSNMLQTSSW